MLINDKNLDEICNEISLYEFKLDTKVSFEIIGHILEHDFKLKPSDVLYKTGFNLLYIKSKQVFQIYCCIKKSFSNTNVLIDLDFIDISLKKLFHPSTQILENKISCKSYLNSEGNLKFFLKHIVNKVFRIHYFFQKEKIMNGGSIIKTWCDVDEKLHLNELNKKDSFIYIFPFVANYRRAIKHILRMRKIKKGQFSLVGINYDSILLLKILFLKGLKRDLNIFEYEVLGYLKHEVDYPKNSHIHTSDEFLPSIYATNELLINRSVRIKNIAHGLGYYSPYTDYTSFGTFNDSQKQFYQNFSPKINYTILYESEIEKNLSIKETLIYIHQNFGDHKDKVYEYNLQENILTILNTKIRDGFKVMVKFHPNTSVSEIKKTLLKFDKLIQVKDLINLNDQLTFLSILSTAYYDFRKKGGFIFISENCDLIKNIYGSQTNCFSINDLKNMKCTA